jgi:hypothetical protein
MRLHKIGANHTQTTQIVPFDSDKFKIDNIGQHLTGKAVSDSTDKVRTNMWRASLKPYYVTRGNLNDIKRYCL